MTVSTVQASPTRYVIPPLLSLDLLVGAWMTDDRPLVLSRPEAAVDQDVARLPGRRSPRLY
jgi:hypothetical protein